MFVFTKSAASALVALFTGSAGLVFLSVRYACVPQGAESGWRPGSGWQFTDRLEYCLGEASCHELGVVKSVVRLAVGVL